MVIHLTEDQSQQLEQIAAAGGPPVDSLAHDAIDSYLHWLADHVEAVQQGLDAANCGDLCSHAEVRERIRQMTAR